MAAAHLIHGRIGVGKTTLARRLERELPALRFTHDEWMLRLYGEDPPAAVFADLHARVSERIEAVWTRALALGLDVVLDLNFWSRRERDRTRALCRELGAEAVLHRLACPEEAAWSRVERRNAALTDSLLITRPTFEALRARFEPLGDDEPRVEAEAPAG